jgi:hypothetical protein
MRVSDPHFFRSLAIVFIYTVLMGTAALSKLREKSAPEWFLKTFQGTMISKLPGGAAGGYWVIAALETILTVLFLAAIFLPAMLPVALTLSLYLFGILCFGLRISGDYQGSANLFIYFTSTLISLALI